jgi:hypothetical protein
VAVVLLIALGVAASRQGPGPTLAALAKLALIALGAALAGLGWLLRQVERADPVATFRLQGPYATVAEALSGGARPSVVLNGVARPEHRELPTAPLSRERCLSVRLSIDRIVAPAITGGEPDDAPGEYEIVAEPSRGVAFLLADETGEIGVDPTAATTDGTITEELTVEPGRDDARLAELATQLNAAGFPVSFPSRDEQGRPVRAYILAEEVIAPSDRVTIIGPVVGRDGAPLIAAGDAGDLFNIAVDDAESPLTQLRFAARRTRIAARLLPFLGLALIALGVALLL